VFFIGLIFGTGCATKRFVSGEVANLDKKVEGVESSFEEKQKNKVVARAGNESLIFKSFLNI